MSEVYEIKPPRNPESIIGRVWALADAMAAKTSKEDVKRSDIMDALAGDVDPSTINAQFQRWRNYNGLVKPTGPRAAKGAAKKAAPKKKAAKKAAKKSPAPKKKAAAKKKRAAKKTTKKK